MKSMEPTGPMRLLTVNTGRPKAVPYTDAPAGVTGIDKRPADGPVRVADPGPKGTGGSGLAGDSVCDLRHHGGSDQAVYAFAREELDAWERELGHPLANGAFGENLTTRGVDVSGARIGERWRIGAGLVLEVTSGRIPCRTFAGHVGEERWVKRFTQAAAPGAYLRVIEPGRSGPGIRSRSCTARITTSPCRWSSWPRRRDGTCCRSCSRPGTRCIPGRCVPFGSTSGSRRRTADHEVPDKH